MNKLIVVGAVVVGLAITGTAFAATYGAQIARATLFAVLEATPNKGEVYRLMDGKTTCYIYSTSISCVK